MLSGGAATVLPSKVVSPVSILSASFIDSSNFFLLHFEYSL